MRSTKPSAKGGTALTTQHCRSLADWACSQRSQRGAVIAPRSAINAGGCFSTKVPDIDTAVTLQFMRTVASHNGDAEGFAQMRIIKVF